MATEATSAGVLTPGRKHPQSTRLGYKALEAYTTREAYRLARRIYLCQDTFFTTLLFHTTIISVL